MIALTIAALLGGSEGFAASQPGDMMVAQRGGRGFSGAGGRGQPPPGIRAVVPGRVTAVDQAQGRITLAIGGASVEAEFPPAEVAAVKLGDRVMVTLELIDTRVAVVTGAVTAVDPVSGAVTLNTPQGPWTSTFAPGAVAGIRPGDQAIVKLGLVDLGPPIESPPPLPGPSAPPAGGTR